MSKGNILAEALQCKIYLCDPDAEVYKWFM